MDIDVLSQFLNLVRRYLSGSLSLDDLEDWFVEHVGTFADRPSDSVSSLAAALMTGLSEMDLGHRTEEELRLLLVQELSGHTWTVRLTDELAPWPVTNNRTIEIGGPSSNPFPALSSAPNTTVSIRSITSDPVREGVDTQYVTAP